MNGCRFKKAFLAVVRRYLTPPPTSTNVERLFSYGGLLLKKNRASMLPEKVDKILFIRENLFLLAFQIDWLFVGLIVGRSVLFPKLLVFI